MTSAYQGLQLSDPQRPWKNPLGPANSWWWIVHVVWFVPEVLQASESTCPLIFQSVANTGEFNHSNETVTARTCPPQWDDVRKWSLWDMIQVRWDYEGGSWNYLLKEDFCYFLLSLGALCHPHPKLQKDFFFKVISTVLPRQEECTQNLCSSLLCNAFFFPGGQCTKPYVMLLYVLFFSALELAGLCLCTSSLPGHHSSLQSPLQTGLGKWPICINLNFPLDNYYAGLSFKNTVPVTYFSSISKREIVKWRKCHLTQESFEINPLLLWK